MLVAELIIFVVFGAAPDEAAPVTLERGALGGIVVLAVLVGRVHGVERGDRVVDDVQRHGWQIEGVEQREAVVERLVQLAPHVEGASLVCER